MSAENENYVLGRLTALLHNAAPNAAAQHPPAANQEEDVLAPLGEEKIRQIVGFVAVHNSDAARKTECTLRAYNALAALLLEVEAIQRSHSRGELEGKMPEYARHMGGLLIETRRMLTNIRQEGV